MLFATAFIASAVLIFWLTSAAAEVAGIQDLPWRWRAAITGVALFLLAAVDLVAVSRSTYCPISIRRQTPRALMHRHAMRFVAFVWGADTGLVFTTFRVAAVSWGALLLTALGFAPSWTGIAYGLGFTLPFLPLLLRPSLGRASRAAVAEDPGFAAMLARRPVLQRASAVLLAVGGVVVMGAS